MGFDLRLTAYLTGACSIVLHLYSQSPTLQHLVFLRSRTNRYGRPVYQYSVLTYKQKVDKVYVIRGMKATIATYCTVGPLAVHLHTG